MGALVGDGQPVGALARGPARACGGVGAERADLVEGEDPVREAVEDFLDLVRLRIGQQTPEIHAKSPCSMVKNR
ncbi:hypothetical protein GCM10010206_60690 [Streptomyces cinerochromogenes]|nr:hypothetical protein GCM10010206_60690 [Streptomyces cinerochromogenes]